MKLVTLSGVVDIHVHFRDPGETHKEDFYTGTCAALAGGVTTVFDMPNNSEPILSVDRLLAKKKEIEKKAVCDFGLYFGTDGNNLEEFKAASALAIGLKIYLTETTGRVIIHEEDVLEDIFQVWPREKPIVIHLEGEKIHWPIAACRKFGNRLHITHVSNRAVLRPILEAKKEGLPITCDVTPHHLLLTKEQGNEKLFLVKPSLETEQERLFLWQHIANIDCIASDHAPHTLSEKMSAEGAFGIPGIETMLPLLLAKVKEGKLTIAEVMRLTCDGPRKIFGIPARQDTYVEVDLDEMVSVQSNTLHTKCGWSPFETWRVCRIKRVFLRGTKVFEDGHILVSAGFGKSIV